MLYSNLIGIFDTEGGMVRIINGTFFNALIDGIDATKFTKQQVIDAGVTQEEINQWIEKAITDHSWKELSSTFPNIYNFIQRVRI